MKENADKHIDSFTKKLFKDVATESPSFDFVDSDGDTLNTSKRKLWEVSNAHLDDSVASQQGIHYQGNPDANHQTRNVVGLIQFPRRPP